MRTRNSGEQATRTSLRYQFGSLSIRRAITASVLAFAMAAAAALQLGGIQGHAFVATAYDGLHPQTVYQLQDKGIYCANGWIAVRQGTLTTDPSKSFPVNVVYTATLFQWTTNGWQPTGTPQSDTESAGQPMKQLTFPQLTRGSYSMTIQVKSYSLAYGSYMGSWTIAPVASDFWFASSFYQRHYCTI